MSSEPPTYVEFKTIQAAIVGGYPGTYESFHRGQTQHQQLFYSWPGRGDKRTERIEANYRLDGRKFNRTQLNEHKSKCKGGKSWPRREHGPKKTVVKCAPKPSDPLSSKTFPTDLLKHQEELRSWVPKEGEITEGPVTRLIISRSSADSSSDGSSHHTGFEKEQKSKESTVSRVTISQSPPDSSTDGTSNHTGLEKEQKSSEGTVTSVIISRSPADLSTDGAFHPIETDEKHKYKAESVLIQQMPRHSETQSEILYERRRQECARVESDTEEAVPIEPIQYWFYQSEQFPRFQYVYNQTRDCESRIEKAGMGRIRTHQMSKKVNIKIGIIGEFTDKDCTLISKRKGKRNNPKGKTSWKAQPLVCFSESWRDDLRLQSACHKILIKSGTLSDKDQGDDSINIVEQNKEQIKDAITTCLEEPLLQMLQELLEDLKNEPSNKTTSVYIAEIEAICKNMKVSSLFSSPDTKSIVPEDVKDYLFRKPNVHSFGIWMDSSFKVFMNKTNKKKLRDDLTKMNPSFFNKYKIEIEQGKLEDKLSHLMQGDEIQMKIPNESDDQNFHTGTLGGIVTKANDKSKKYALSCNHLFPKVGLRAYNNKYEDIGTCLYTTTFCDFAAIEIEKPFSENCDETFRNEDGKKTNAKVFSQSLTNVGIVHKIGAATEVTKGMIFSSEYYDKLFDDDNREHMFLVKGIPGNFSQDGDSGSLVFSRPQDAQQTYVYVLGMVYGSKVRVSDDDDDDDDDDEQNKKTENKPNNSDGLKNNGNDQKRNGENLDDNKSLNTSYSHESDVADSNAKEFDNISSCYRIHTALELFKQNQGEEVKFKDDLSLSSPSTSPVLSTESDDSPEETP